MFIIPQLQMFRAAILDYDQRKIGEGTKCDRVGGQEAEKKRGEGEGPGGVFQI